MASRVTIRAPSHDDRERVARPCASSIASRSIFVSSVTARSSPRQASTGSWPSIRNARWPCSRPLAGSDDTVIGSGRYVVTGPGTAEVGFVVEEDYHGRGLASRLLRHLAPVARDHGITSFEADVIAGNKAMQAVFQRTGWPTHKRREGDVRASDAYATPWQRTGKAIAFTYRVERSLKRQRRQSCRRRARAPAPTAPIHPAPSPPRSARRPKTVMTMPVRKGRRSPA